MNASNREGVYNFFSYSEKAVAYDPEMNFRIHRPLEQVESQSLILLG